MSEAIFASDLRRCLKPGKASNEDVLLMVNAFDGDLTAAVNVPNENGVRSIRNLRIMMRIPSREMLCICNRLFSYFRRVSVNETSVSAIFVDTSRKNCTHVCCARRWPLGPGFCG